jgi:transcriptional regulator with XRE-family HTH domain
MKENIEAFGRKLATARGSRGVRDAAKEIDISPATLSRVERGYMPDLDTFGKICRWLKVDPAEVLGIKEVVSTRPAVAVHFRKDQALRPETAQALAQMILAAQRAMLVTNEE